MTTVGQVEGSIFIRYSGSMVKKQVKVTATEGLVSLLEKALKAFGLETTNCMQNYSLHWQNKPVDLATCIRFSPISFGCTLDLVRKTRASKFDQPVAMIPLCVQDMETSQRYSLEVNTLNITLLELLALCEMEFGICVFARRKGFLPQLLVNGSSYKCLSLPDYSLAVAGGRNALLRLSYVKSDEGISQLLQTLQGKDLRAYLQKLVPIQPAVSPTVTVVEQPVEDESAAIDRQVVVLPELPHHEIPSETDSFFQLSLSEVQQQYSSQVQASARRQNTPLQSARLIKEKKDRQLREKYKDCTIRFRFSDNSAIDATFKADERVHQLYKFLELQKSITGPLLSIPGQIDNLSSYKNATLFDAGLIPRALVIVKS